MNDDRERSIGRHHAGLQQNVGTAMKSCKELRQLLIDASNQPFYQTALEQLNQIERALHGVAHAAQHMAREGMEGRQS